MTNNQEKWEEKIWDDICESITYHSDGSTDLPEGVARSLFKQAVLNKLRQEIRQAKWETCEELEKIARGISNKTMPSDTKLYILLAISNLQNNDKPRS